MNFKCHCTNPRCPTPSIFEFKNAKPVTVAIVACASCGWAYRFVLKLDGSFDCHPYEDGIKSLLEPAVNAPLR